MSCSFRQRWLTDGGGGAGYISLRCARNCLCAPRDSRGTDAIALRRRHMTRLSHKNQNRSVWLGIPTTNGARALCSAVVVVGSVALAARSASGQVTTGCWESVPTTACALCSQPLCIPCGFKRCCHRLMVNESGELVTDIRPTTGPGFDDWASPVVYALCDLRLRVCVGTACIDTGVVYAVYCGSRAAVGDACP